MKYRIAELMTGKFMVQLKYSIFDCWDNYSIFNDLIEARNCVNRFIEDDIERKERKKSKKIKRIVEVFK